MEDMDAIRHNFVKIATVYAKARGIKLETLSREIHGNRHFLRDFKSGECSVTLSKAKEMLAKLRQEWPDHLSWPEVFPVRMGKKIL